jgi:CubicO group peptidase (beta-lactamase class C family)
MAGLEHAVPNQPGTVYHVASISKQFTAFAIHLLAREGRLSLDDDVRGYLPELHDFGRVITLRHLLYHSSGLRDQWRLLGLAGWRQEDMITQQDVLNLIWRQRELNFEPGKEFDYTNTGYTLLGLIVQRVSGRSLREFTAQRVFGPLRMRDTHFLDDPREIVRNRAASYEPQADGGYRESLLAFGAVGATSLLTTAADLARWDGNFTSGRVGGRELLSGRFVWRPRRGARRPSSASLRAASAEPGKQRALIGSTVIASMPGADILRRNRRQSA